MRERGERLVRHVSDFPEDAAEDPGDVEARGVRGQREAEPPADLDAGRDRLRVLVERRIRENAGLPSGRLVEGAARVRGDAVRGRERLIDAPERDERCGKRVVDREGEVVFALVGALRQERSRAL